MSEKSLKGLSRRAWLKLAGAGLLLAAGGWTLLRKRFLSDHTTEDQPIISYENHSSQSFDGDQPSKSHAFLWQKEKMILESGGLPPPSEHHPLVIIGGGIAGLTSAFLMRDLKPLVLDQSHRWGGNSKGGFIDDALFSTGAAYFVPPEAGSPTFQLLRDLNLATDARTHEGHGLIFSHQQFTAEFWKRNQTSINKLTEIYQTAYPAIPFHSDGPLSHSSFIQLDKMKFSDWISKNLQVSSEFRAYLSGYCMSSFGGDCHELSAAQALSFITSDLSSISVLPGGNAAIAQRLYERLKSSGLTNNLRHQCLTIDINMRPSGVNISYVDHENKLKTISANHCIVAAPKFVAHRLIDQMKDSQREAMKAIKYRSYLVANLILKSPLTSLGYDIFHLDSFTQPSSPLGPQFTDMIFAGWSQYDKASRGVLTFYKPLPIDNARPLILNPGSLPQIETELRQAITPLLSALSLRDQDIDHMIITRIGHAMPLAEPGLLAHGTLEAAHKPIDQRIFFANQDNWANPCFETSVGSAYQVAQHLRSKTKIALTE